MSWLAAATIGSALLSHNSARQNNATQKDLTQQQLDLQKQSMYSGYQIAAKDLKKAGINPILAGRWGPAQYGSTPVPQFQNTGLAAAQGGQAGANILQTAASTDRIQVQTEIQENVAEIAGNFMDAWRNTGKNLTEWMKTADWQEIGEIIGKSVSAGVNDIVKYIKNMWTSPSELIREFLQNDNGSLPVEGDATHPTYQSAPKTGLIQR